MTEQAGIPTAELTTVLLVDDEENILSSLRRLLRHQPWRILTATSGAEALAILERETVDLIVSDARMPGMDGAALLSQVREVHPDCMRIMLTGYAEMATIMSAINNGQIYQYLTKPWNDEHLVLTLSKALDHQATERERSRLERLALEQNTQLRLLNESLDSRVKARTAELQQTSDMLDLSFEELRRSYVTSTEVFSLLINQRLPKGKQTNQDVISLVRAFCEDQAIDIQLSRDMTMAAALYNIGKLSWSDNLIVAPADLLYQKNRATYRSYPTQSESLLMTLEPLQDAARLIRFHQERWDGSGFPDNLKGEAIPFGSRLLKLAVDFVELQVGLYLERYLNRDEALLFIRNNSGKLYDPNLAESFISTCVNYLTDVKIGDPAVRAVSTRKLVEGMILARNLHAENGMLLLNEGKQLSSQLIEKLIAFEAVESGHYTVFVRDPLAG
ncbi:response regulator [Pseudomonas kuykendallii]|uniref:Response regulator c-di-GMP phosphodiesterase, RpfG family, contains REC and HD-GYP domains n=1 Tax=Pseudomonas kuykendallii TaxID=1007099 RepID=A0A1H2ZWX3_9PSED|nr:HD domain-containing phosphohydrolase [Pseudomonas kuykendallii]MCQ4272046.1 response regulator [Pseudomonas kuykendallii]SDX21398.1 Response regulator c-di-GMP phosphodiesterase, RpfG family, contains REC and HD-GYP domains [Pseudomonas kuykendallii]